MCKPILFFFKFMAYVFFHILSKDLCCMINDHVWAQNHHDNLQKCHSELIGFKKELKPTLYWEPIESEEKKNHFSEVPRRISQLNLVSSIPSSFIKKCNQDKKYMEQLRYILDYITFLYKIHSKIKCNFFWKKTGNSVHLVQKIMIQKNLNE